MSDEKHKARVGEGAEAEGGPTPGAPPRLPTGLTEPEEKRVKALDGPVVPAAAPRPPKPKKEKGKKKQKKGLGSKRGVETMFRTSYGTHIDLSSIADNKANIMISINGLILSIVLATVAPQASVNPSVLIPTTVLLVTCLISIIYAVLCARPRVSHANVTLEDVRQRRTNILFFGNFVNMPREDFLVGMKDLIEDTDTLYEHMIKDLYGLGIVLDRKFSLLRVSYTVFMIGLAVSVFLYLVFFFLVSL